MDTKDKDLINKNYAEILRSLTTAVDDVCIQLWHEHIITDFMKENILAKSSSLKRADVLLDLIVTRGPKAFEALYKSVLDVGLFGAADILHPERSPHETAANNGH